MNGVLILSFVAALILVPIVLLIALGHFASRWIARRSPDSQMIKRVTPIQALQYAILVAALMIVTAIGKLSPTTTLGKLFAFPRGVILVTVLFWLVTLVIAIGVVVYRRLRKRRRGGI